MKIEPHAQNRAVERFGVARDQAANWIREQFATAVYVGEIFDKNGNRRRIFSNGSVLLGVNADEARVHTVFKPRSRHQGIKRKVVDVLEKEILRIERHLEKVKRESTIKIAEIQVEIAQVNLRKVKSKSKAIHLACDARISALYEEVREIQIELESAEAERKRAVKTKAAYV